MLGAMCCGSVMPSSRATVFATLESTRMSAVRRRAMPCIYARSFEITAACRRLMPGNRRPAHRAARRKAA
jgi:hypothetical protein